MEMGTEAVGGDGDGDGGGSRDGSDGNTENG
jgi:hypothetical protein